MSARKNVNQSRPRALADDGADDAAGAAAERVTGTVDDADAVWRRSRVCLWRRILGRLVRQRQPAALGEFRSRVAGVGAADRVFLSRRGAPAGSERNARRSRPSKPAQPTT